MSVLNHRWTILMQYCTLSFRCGLNRTPLRLLGFFFCILILSIEKRVHTVLGARCCVNAHWEKPVPQRASSARAQARQMQGETNTSRWEKKRPWRDTSSSTGEVEREHRGPIPNPALDLVAECFLVCKSLFSQKTSSQVNRGIKKLCVFLYVPGNKLKPTKSHH